MGKYMKKAKTTGEIAVRDLSLGVRTRAKSLARLPPLPDQTSFPPSSGGYLQLRSRLLFKPPILVHDSKRQKHGQHSEPDNPGPNSDAGSKVLVAATDCQALGSGLMEGGGDKIGQFELKKESFDNNVGHNCDSKDLGIEATFGENVLDIEGKETWIRDPESKTSRGCIPTAHEMNDFFSRVEDTQHKQFIQKYNFDPVSDKPLPGRYEWEKLAP